MTKWDEGADELTRDSKEFLMDAAEGDAPTAEDRERIRRALLLAVAGSAAASGTAVGAAVTSGATGAAGVSGAAGAGAAGAGAAGVAAAAAGSGVAGKVISTILVIGAIGAGAAGVNQLIVEEPSVSALPDSAAEVESPSSEPAGEREFVESVTSPETVAEESPDEVPRPDPEVVEEDTTPPEAPEVQPRRGVPVQVRPSEPGNETPSPPAAAAVEPELEPETTPTVEDALTQELDLLRRAQQARASGNTAVALQLLQEHATRFPRGNLSRERRVSQILVMCESGQQEQARRLAEQFLARSGDSPVAARIRRACGL